MDTTDASKTPGGLHAEIVRASGEFPDLSDDELRTLRSDALRRLNKLYIRFWSATITVCVISVLFAAMPVIDSTAFLVGLGVLSIIGVIVAFGLIYGTIILMATHTRVNHIEHECKRRGMSLP